jgi:hypothetical protein
MVSEAFFIATLRYRARGGRLYKLAIDHGMSPSLLSATISGSRQCDYDERVVKIGEALGVKPEDVFQTAAP